MDFYKAIFYIPSNFSDGTYDLRTKNPVQLENGYQVTFQQRDVKQYSEKFYNFLTKSLKDFTLSSVYLGVFNKQKELSFFVKSKEVALEIAREFNQHSIFDWDVCDIIENSYYKV